MKRFKLLGVGVLAVCALSLVALPVSVASAKKVSDVLQLNEWNEEKEEWVEAGKEASGYIEVGFSYSNCVLKAGGHLTGNKAATIVMDGGTGRQETCSAGDTVSGEIESVSLAAKTKAAHVTASVTVDEEGCRYTFTKFPKSMKLTIPGRVLAGGTVTAKGSKSNPAGCAKSVTRETLVELNSADDEFFETDLVPA